MADRMNRKQGTSKQGEVTARVEGLMGKRVSKKIADELHAGIAWFDSGENSPRRQLVVVAGRI